MVNFNWHNVTQFYLYRVTPSVKFTVVMGGGGGAVKPLDVLELKSMVTSR